MFNPNEHMIDLKGKQYLQVMWRLVWMREEHPDWTIKTELILYDRESGTAAFKAEILNEEGRPLSTGYGSESVKDFRDYLEKAETKSVGRALAMLGYGTQFAPDLDEGERIVDSPVQVKAQMCSDTQVSLINQMCEERNVNKAKLAAQYKATSIDKLTFDQAEDCIVRLGKSK